MIQGTVLTAPMEKPIVGKKDPESEWVDQQRYYKRLGILLPNSIPMPVSKQRHCSDEDYNPVLINRGMSSFDLWKKMGAEVYPCSCFHRQHEMSQHSSRDEWGWMYGSELGLRTRGLSPEQAETLFDKEQRCHLNLLEGGSLLLKEFMPWEEYYEAEDARTGVVNELTPRERALATVLRVVTISNCDNLLTNFAGTQCGHCKKVAVLQPNGKVKIYFYKLDQNRCWGFGSLKRNT